MPDGENSKKGDMIPATFEKLTDNLERLAIKILKNISHTSLQSS